MLYLPFDTADGNTSPDTTGGGHDATLMGNAALAEGISGQALDLNGSVGTYADLPDGTNMLMGDAYTVSVWANKRVDQGYDRLFDFGNNTVLIDKNIKCSPCSLHGDKECPKGHFNCMRQITGKEVFETIENSVKI